MTANVHDVLKRPFDYVITGGGTAGLTLAAKLSEDPKRTVLVLEAGGDNIDDPFLLRPSIYGRHFGKPDYAWTHKTIPQKYAGGMEMPLDRGKGLGGSSGINFFGWAKPPSEDFNDFERLGNPGWNWESLNHAVTKLEGFIPPKDEALARIQMKAGLWQLGTKGPIKISFPPRINPFETAFQDTLFELGYPPAPNPCGGDIKGYFIAPATHDPRTYSRSYATTAFYLPNKDRPNLAVLVKAYVTRVITKSPNTGQDVVATGVEFIHDGQKYIIDAKKEVIVCAGTLKSPQILELSGIGNPDILKKIGVPVKVNLPGVGENVQDHLLLGLSYELKEDPDFETFDLLTDPAVNEEHLELQKIGRGIYTQAYIGYAFMSLEMFSLRAKEIQVAARESIKKKWDTLSPAMQEQYSLELDRIKYGRPSIEFLTFPGNLSQPNPARPGKKYLSLSIGNYHALSRGTIHCTSNDPLKDPEFDMHYFEDDADLEVMAEGARFMRKVANTAPLKNLFVEELNPGPKVRDEDMREHVKKAFYSPWHTACSCSMRPREKDGVVDTRLKVYGTKNLRVVDLSVIPIHVAAHTQATVYAIAERASEMIIEEEA